MTLSSFVNEYFVDALGMPWPDILLVIILCMSLVFFAIGLRSGLILTWAFLGIIFMVFYESGVDTFHVLTLFVVVGVIMVVSLFISHAHEKSGVIGV